MDLSTLAARLGKRRMLKLIGLYPPYLGAGIRVADVDGDIDAITLEMGLYPWNRNYVGTQFGGSLYSMCDPWFMLLLLWRLGPGYVVWDKAATIRFLKPGRGRVRARFELSQEQAEAVRAQLDSVGKAEPQFTVDVTDDQGVVLARVEKTLHAHKPAPGRR
jgi:hypothetical protein